MDSTNVLPLGDVVRPTRQRVKPADYADLPFIGMEHIEANTMKLLGTVPAGTMKSAAVHFKPGDVLYGRLRPYLNKVYRPAFEGLCSAEFIVLPENERIDGAYLKYFLNSSDFVRFATHLNSGDRPRVDFDQISQREIPLPRIDEQIRIVAEIETQFTRLDDAVASLRHVKGNLKRYKAAVLKAAVEGRLVFTEAELARRDGRTYETGDELLRRVLGTTRRGFRQTSEAHDDQAEALSGPASMPTGWTLTTVDAVGDVLLGRQRAPQYLTGRYPTRYLRVANIKDDFIDFSDLNEMDFDEAHFAKYRLQPGDILVSEGQSPELLGQSAIFRGHVEPLCFQKTLHRFRATPNLTTPEFAQLVFRSHVCSGVFRRLGSITTNIGHLTLEKFKASPFPLPPLDEQHRIVAECSRRQSLLAALADAMAVSSDRCAAVRSSLLTLAFGSQTLDMVGEPV